MNRKEGERERRSEKGGERERRGWGERKREGKNERFKQRLGIHLYINSTFKLYFKSDFFTIRENDHTRYEYLFVLIARHGPSKNNLYYIRLRTHFSPASQKPRIIPL